ncbi:unnamed protein product (macronuclear) [Paramecium tetraurelia]|uniref:Transmembrane protein n=1 Tax=Paramecium tetraurelia TaxID=5888 RepID=A0BXM8_PARTE|nr:uncharacterized protein GSPATT00033148001 [Paramecium tetraurelia]CAK63295.1 unnamed protein product [Paramecium tetraurelia]|eukprot:XP_001430693.1 hypothetical protein (macronuclear) [Paramecium tetraurelia strain d4-2]
MDLQESARLIIQAHQDILMNFNHSILENLSYNLKQELLEDIQIRAVMCVEFFTKNIQYSTIHKIACRMNFQQFTPREIINQQHCKDKHSYSRNLAKSFKYTFYSKKAILICQMRMMSASKTLIFLKGHQTKNLNDFQSVSDDNYEYNYNITQKGNYLVFEVLMKFLIYYALFYYHLL